MTAFCAQGHYQPGLTIDDPHAPGRITLADPAVVANWDVGCRFRNVARMIDSNGKIWDYPLRDVAASLRVASTGNGKGKGRYNPELDEAADPLGDDKDDEDGDCEFDGETAVYTSGEDEDEDESEDDYHISEAE